MLCFEWIPDSLKTTLGDLILQAQQYLINSQNADGSWGGDIGLTGTIEETALTVSALTNNRGAESMCELGMKWLQQQKKPLQSAPIGLYFASLWYDEKLYPQVMYMEALMRVKTSISERKN
jgi:hypothetical protein